MTFHNHLDNIRHGAFKFENFHLKIRILKYFVGDIKFLIFHLENSSCRIKNVKSMSFFFFQFHKHRKGFVKQRTILFENLLTNLLKRAII